MVVGFKEKNELGEGDRVAEGHCGKSSLQR